MTDLARKGVTNEMKWTDAQEKAYVTLKKALTSYPILHLPSWTKQFHIRTDALNKGLGAVAHATWHRPSCHSQEQRELLSTLRAAFWSSLSRNILPLTLLCFLFSQPPHRYQVSSL